MTAPSPKPLETVKIGWKGWLLLLLPVVLLVAGALVLALSIALVGLLLLALGALDLALDLALGGTARLHRALGGRLAEEYGDALLVSVVEGLCVANGIRPPELRILSGEAPNALCLSTHRDEAVLYVTEGLLGLFDRIELEGLVAHELAHLKRGDTRAAAVAMRFLAPLALFGERARGLLSLVGDPTREVEADLLASAMTRYPPGLRSALEKVAAAPSVRPTGLSATTERLSAPYWFAPLDEATRRIRPGVLELRLRVSALAEL